MKAISSLERIDIEEDALQLIVARADGSLCEAEITLDQLSTLGQKITIEVVSEMVKTSLEHYHVQPSNCVLIHLFLSY